MPIDNRNDSRIHNRLPIAREGIPFTLIGCLVTLLFFLVGWSLLGFIFTTLTLFTAWFFRDPDRNPDLVLGAVFSPADGKVIQILPIDPSDSPIEKAALKISIFMSVVNVHVNRIPADGVISKILYEKGRFFSANLDKASKENEHNKILLETQNGTRIMFVQIAGLIARRIACWVKEGDRVVTGQRFGLIRFGSRLDVFLPAESRIIVSPNEKVKAGITVLGYLK